MVAVAREKIPEGYKKTSVQTYTPEMMDLWHQMMEGLGPDSFMSKLAGGDQSAFAEMEAPALRQFGELQGNMASRFSDFGMGGRHGSGFQNSMNQAGSDFASDLASKRTDYRLNAIKEMHNMSNQMLQNNPYDTQLQKKDQSSGGWGGAIGAGLGGLAGFLSPMPGGLMEGANLGYKVGSKF